MVSAGYGQSQAEPAAKTLGERPAKREAPVAKPGEEVEPPEEDAGLQEKEYSFNPLQAEKEIKIGNYYAKKGSWKAARGRYSEATKWEPTNPLAWLKLGEANEKAGDKKAAKAAYAQFLQLDAENKAAPGVRKKIAGW